MSTPEIRDFDQEFAQRPTKAFRAGGHTITLRRSVRPEVLIAWGDFDQETAKPEESIEIMDKVMRQIVAPDSVEAWDVMRRQSEDEGAQEVGLDMLVEIVQYAIASVSGRPTSQPSSSGPGLNGTGTSSTDDSQPRGLISTPSPSAAT